MTAQQVFRTIDTMIDALLTACRDHMKKALEVTSVDLGGIRSGRATPALVEHIIVSAYGDTQKLKLMEMATITVQDAKSILIAPYDPSQVSEIAKGIQEAHTGLMPVVDGDVVRITIPPLSEERRREYIKLAHAKLEAGKVMMRQIRQDAMKDLKKIASDKKINEDDEKLGEKKIQEITDLMVKELDELGKRKEIELLQV